MFVAGAPASPAAQNQQPSAWTYTVEVVGNVAHGRLYLGDNLWGSGTDWGVGAEVRPLSGWLDRLGFEIQVVRLEDSGSLGSQVSHRLSATLVVADARYHFRGHARVQPYLFGGLGHVSADYTYSCTDCVFDRDPATGGLVSRGVQESRDKGSKNGFAFGAGLELAARRHVSIRPELLFADTTPGSGYNWGWVQMQIGLGVRF
jgi:opacity protein-like surface antigen